MVKPDDKEMDAKGLGDLQVRRALWSITRLARLENCLLAVALLFVGFAIVGAPADGSSVVASSCAVLLVVAYGNCHNDIVDSKLDADSDVKRRRPLPVGAITIEWAKLFRWGLAVLAIVVSTLISAAAFIVVAAMLVLAYLYTSLFKGIPLIGNALVGFQCASVLLFAGLVTGRWDAPLLPLSVVVAVGMMSVEIAKSVEDAEVDRMHRIGTVAHMLSVRMIQRLMAFLLALASAVFFVSYPAVFIDRLLLTVLVVAPLIALSLWWTRPRVGVDARQAARLSKWAWPLVIAVLLVTV